MSWSKSLLRLLLGKRLPVLSGSVTVSGLSAPVRVRRDRWGIPVIEAASDADAWFGVGFRRAAEDQLPALAPDARAVMEAYARGVTAGFTAGLTRRPHELAVFGRDPGPWEAADVAAFLKFLSFLLPAHWNVELARLQVLLADGPEVRDVASRPRWPNGTPSAGGSCSGPGTGTCPAIARPRPCTCLCSASCVSAWRRRRPRRGGSGRSGRGSAGSSPTACSRTGGSSTWSNGCATSRGVVRPAVAGGGRRRPRGRGPVAGGGVRPVRGGGPVGRGPAVHAQARGGRRGARAEQGVQHRPGAGRGDSNTPFQATVIPLNPLGPPTNLPNFRMVIDVGAWENSRFVLAGGQSGNPLSPNYADLFEVWQQGEGVPIPWTPEEVAAAAVHDLRLEPDRRQWHADDAD